MLAAASSLELTGMKHMTKSKLLNSEQRFGVVAQWLHWSMFVLIALQVAGGHVLDELPRRTAIRGIAYDAHETLGLIVLFLVFLRMSWKMANPAPVALGRQWQLFAARAAHVALYVLMIAVPIVGYLMVDAKGHDVALFGWTGPDLVATNKTLADRLEDLHAILAWALTAIVGVHAGAAVWHQVVLRDGTLTRMLPAARG
jgi:superoxide oxidase